MIVARNLLWSAGDPGNNLLGTSMLGDLLDVKPPEPPKVIVDDHRAAVAAIDELFL